MSTAPGRVCATHCHVLRFGEGWKTAQGFECSPNLILVEAHVDRAEVVVGPGLNEIGSREDVFGYEEQILPRHVL